MNMPEAANCTTEGRIRIGGIIHWPNLVLLGIMDFPDRPGTAAQIFSALGRNGVNVPFIVQSIDLEQRTHVVFCVARGDYERAMASLYAVREYLGGAVIVEEPEVALVSVFGPDFRERPGIAGAVFSSIAGEGVNILAISTSISTVSCLVHQDKLAQSLEALKATFVLP